MDIYRLAKDQGGGLHILAPPARVETMLSMAGVHKIVPIFREEGKPSRPSRPRPGSNNEKPRHVRLSTGFEVPLDGDLLAIIEALYKEVTLGNVLNSSFETMRAEILSVIDQMSASEQRAYLAESLFLNSVTYESDAVGLRPPSRGQARGRAEGQAPRGREPGQP